MIQELLDILSQIDSVEDMDVIAYHVRKRHELLAKQAKLAKHLNS